jgi:predicted outer membrane protein
MEQRTMSIKRNAIKRSAMWVGLLAVAALGASAVAEAHDHGSQARRSLQGVERGKVDRAQVDRILSRWPDQVRVTSYALIGKYGLPHEVTATQLVWHDNGSFKRTVVRNEPSPHLFPVPHDDFVEQVIAYAVPADKLAELAAFNGSVSVARTAGELSSRCDSEQTNFIALNLAVEIVRGLKNAEQAREVFNETMTALLTQEQPPAIASQLQFAPAAAERAANPGVVTLPGAPHPAAAADIEPVAGGREPQVAAGDRTVLGALAVLNENERLLGMHALERALDARVQAYATMLMRDHGQALERTLKLGAALDDPPVLGGAATALRAQSQSELANLLTLHGKRFEAEFLDIAVRQHEEALRLLDRELTPAAQGEAVRRELRQLRPLLAGHLRQAKQLQAQR